MMALMPVMAISAGRSWEREIGVIVSAFIGRSGMSHSSHVSAAADLGRLAIVCPSFCVHRGAMERLTRQDLTLPTRCQRHTTYVVT